MWILNSFWTIRHLAVLIWTESLKRQNCCLRWALTVLTSTQDLRIAITNIKQQNVRHEGTFEKSQWNILNVILETCNIELLLEWVFFKPPVGSRFLITRIGVREACWIPLQSYFNLLCYVLISATTCDLLSLYGFITHFNYWH